jgi:hypothetical protein
MSFYKDSAGDPMTLSSARSFAVCSSPHQVLSPRSRSASAPLLLPTFCEIQDTALNHLRVEMKNEQIHRTAAVLKNQLTQPSTLRCLSRQPAMCMCEIHRLSL